MQLRLHEGEALDVVLPLFEYYNLSMCVHLPIVFQQKLIAVDQEEYLLYPEFWL